MSLKPTFRPVLKSYQNGGLFLTGFKKIFSLKITSMLLIHFRGNFAHLRLRAPSSRELKKKAVARQPFKRFWSFRNSHNFANVIRRFSMKI